MVVHFVSWEASMPFWGDGSVVVGLLFTVAPVFVRVLWWSLFWCTLLRVLSGFAVVFAGWGAGCYAFIVF